MIEPAKTVTVLNTPCTLTDSARLTELLSKHCLECRESTPPLSVDFTNVHIVAMRARHPDFYQSTSRVDWFIPDSQILTWAVSLLGGENHERVYGPDFMGYFLENGNQALSHFFFGASQTCLDLLHSEALRIRPDLKIAGKRNGYFNDVDESEIIGEINRSSPDVLWVGLGTPKQQAWIHENKAKLNVKVILAVGFAFDVNAGTKRDAPAWLGPIGLTWLYRLLSEPRRLWRRYLVYNSIFLSGLFRQLRSDDTPFVQSQP